MRTVLVFGTFDIFHPGHEFFLREARKHGDRLIVSMPADDAVTTMKRRPPVRTFNDRKAALMATGLVDDVIESDPPEEHGKFTSLEAVAPDIVVLGYDQQMLAAALDEWKTRYQKSLEIVTMPAYKPELYKSSLLRTKPSV